MTNDDKQSPIETRANNILKEHNGVYLERRLYTTLKREFPDLKKADFKEILNELLQSNYVLERGLIKPQLDKGSKKSSKKYVDESKPGKGASDHQRIPDKRL
jgi:hypothetical protein